MRISLYCIQIEYHSVFRRQFSYYVKKVICLQSCIILIIWFCFLFLNLIYIINTIKVMPAAVFLESCIYSYPAHPSFKRTFVFIIAKVFKYFDKTLLQNVPCLFIITGILQTNGIQLGG